LLNNKKIIFESIDKRKKKNYNPTILKGNPVVIVCQNINFYMGGTEHIWGSTNQIGIQPCGLKRGEKKLFEQDLLKSFQNQLSNDRKIEFITYSHGMDMGLDRVARGNAKKIHQGKGPFIFTFKKINIISIIYCSASFFSSFPSLSFFLNLLIISFKLLFL
jgi:hypothetical protein